MQPLMDWNFAGKSFQLRLDCASSMGNDLTAIFDYLMLNAESAIEASNTEVLMTIMRDLAVALQGCSPRLLESDERSFEAGTDMPSNIYSQSFSVQGVLHRSDVFEAILVSLGQFDDDQLMKSIFHTLGHECLLSINKNLNGQSAAIDSLFEVSVARETFMPSTDSSLNCYNMVQYGGEDDSEMLFPLEPCDIAPDDETKYASWPDIFRDLPWIEYDGGTTKKTRSTSNGWDVDWTEAYSNMNRKASANLSEVLALLDTSWIPDGVGMAGASFFPEFIVVSCLGAVEAIITDEGSSMDECSAETAVALWWINQAASDENMLRCLMLFLSDLYLTLTYDPMAADGPGSGGAAAAWMAPMDGSSSRAKRRGKRTRDSGSATAASAMADREASAAASVDRTCLKAVLLASKEMTSFVSETLSPLIRKGSYVSSNGDAGGDPGALSSNAPFYAEYLQQAILKSAISYDHVFFSNPNPASTYDGMSFDTDELVSILARSASSEGMFSRFLNTWEDVMSVERNGYGVFNKRSTDQTAYSGTYRTHMQVGYLVGAVKLYSSIFSGTFTAMSDMVDSTAVSISWDAENFAKLHTSLVSLLTNQYGVGYEDFGMPSGGPGIAAASQVAMEEGSSYYAEVKAADGYDADQLTSALMVIDALQAESDSGYEAVTALKTYFYEISSAFQELSSLLGEGLQVEPAIQSTMGVKATEELGKMIVNGLKISSDSLAYLQMAIGGDNVEGPEFGWRNNTPSGYSREPMVDKAYSPSYGFNDFFSVGMEKLQNVDPLPTKIMAVGLPTGFLDELEVNPVALDSLSRQSWSVDHWNYEVVLEKIDLTRPDVIYKEQVFEFPRYMYFQLPWVNFNQHAWSYSLAWAPAVVADPITLGGNNLTSTGFLGTMSTDIWSDEALHNLRMNTVLKLYLDTIYGVSTWICDFPVNETAQNEIKDSKIYLQAWGDDTTTSFNDDTFLTASCAAFVSSETSAKYPSGFEWFSTDSTPFYLDSSKYPSSSEENVIYSYLNTLTSTVDGSSFAKKLYQGVIFENILCIPYDPKSFELDTEAASSTSPTTMAMDTAEKEVSIGLETSEGIDAASFRVTIRFPDSGGE